MAVAMTPSRHDTPFSSSLHGTGAARLYEPQPSASAADLLPSIDFNFADLRERMAVFTARFDDFIERGRKRVLEERNAFKLNMAELQESQKQTRTALSTLETTRTSHAELLAREADERADLQTAIADLEEERDTALSRRAQLDAQIAELQSTLAARRATRDARARHLEGQARLNGPEVRFWESLLGMRIESAGGEERLRFVFSCVDVRDAGREAKFVLDVKGREGYRVVETDPVVEHEKVEGVVERLNEGGDLGGFLKGMRGLFVDAMR